MRLLSKKNRRQQWLAHFVDNMKKHRDIEYERNLILKEFFGGSPRSRHVTKKSMSEWIVESGV